MKYIILQDEQGMEIPIIFPDRIVHSSIAKRLVHMLMMDERKITKVVAAGFCSIKAHCSGESESLDISSRPNDNVVLCYNDSIGGMGLDILPPGVLDTLKGKLKE